MTKFVSRHSGQVQKMLEEAYQQGRADMFDELFNTPIEEFNGMSLKEVYEQPCSMPFDEGWNECYENFLMVAEYLKEQNK